MANFIKVVKQDGGYFILNTSKIVRVFHNGHITCVNVEGINGAITIDCNFDDFCAKITGFYSDVDQLIISERGVKKVNQFR